MSKSGRGAAVYICMCLCLPVCVHILVLVHNLNQYTQEGGIKANNQLQAPEAASRPRAPNVLSTPQSFQSVQQTTLSTFVSFSPRTRFLFSVCLLETINLWLLPVALLSSFQFFFVFFYQWELSSLTFVHLERTAVGNKGRQPITDRSEWLWVCESHSWWHKKAWNGF